MGPRLVQDTSQEATIIRAPVGDGADPLVPLASAVIAMALALLGRQARYRPADAAWLGEMAALLGGQSRPPVPREPSWPYELLTQSETRVLRYLPTHLSAPEIAAELCVSVNTVKTHVRHLYRKLGAHGRHEAVCRARAIGLLAMSRGVGGRESYARRAAGNGRAASRPG